ncbi:MAG: hypothetical protein ACT4QC_22165 [Planctomycetaceae bacterium]
MRLLLAAPRLAHRDCDDCQKHVYDEQTGHRALHAGLPVVRPPGTHPPCRLPHVGCLKGTPENAHVLSEANRRAFRHYLGCAATATFPDDPIVRRHAALLRAIEAMTL